MDVVAMPEDPIPRNTEVDVGLVTVHLKSTAVDATVALRRVVIDLLIFKLDNRQPNSGSKCIRSNIVVIEIINPPILVLFDNGFIFLRQWLNPIGIHQNGYILHHGVDHVI
jgi:hypothetical protein